MKVSIVMGSDSDWPILKPAYELLKKFDIEAEVVVASAHRTPAKVRELVTTAPERGIGAFIAAAGAAAHLGGVIASYTTLPVIGVPARLSTDWILSSPSFRCRPASLLPLWLSTVPRMQRFLLPRCLPSLMRSWPRSWQIIAPRW